MNDRDLDLILDYVEHRVSPQEAAALEARLAVEPELAAEVAAQRTAITFVRAAGTVAMTGAERARMHAALLSDLHLRVPEPAPVAAERRLRSWMAPVVSIAGIAAVVVAAFVILPGMMGGGNDTLEIADTAAVSGDTTAAPEAVTRQTDDEGGAFAEDGDAATTMTLAAAEAPVVPRVETYDLSDLDETTAAGGEEALELTAIDIDQFERCLDELATQLPGTSGYVVRAVTEQDGRDLLLVSYVDETGAPGGAAIDPVSCVLVATADS